jgi:hypothetical protein
VLSHLVQMYEENDHEHRSQIQACFHERDKNLNRNSLGKRISVKPSFLVPSVSKYWTRIQIALLILYRGW